MYEPGPRSLYASQGSICGKLETSIVVYVTKKKPKDLYPRATINNTIHLFYTLIKYLYLNRSLSGYDS